MTCFTNITNGTEILLDYCAGTLTQEQAAEVTQHTAQCAGCRGLVEAQRNVWQSLDLFTAFEVSPDFDQQLYARIAREQTLSPFRQWLNRSLDGIVGIGAVPFWKPALAGAGACVLAAGLLVQAPRLFEKSGPESPSAVSAGASVPSESRVQKNPVEQGRADHVDVDRDMDQVEQTLKDLDLLTQPPSTSGTM
jgi:anti-sigma factor RsiW